MEFFINDQIFYPAGDLTIPARSDAGVDTRKGPSCPGPKPDDGGKEGDANKENQGEYDPMEGKSDRMSEFVLGALERDLLENDLIKRKAVGRMKR